MHEPENKELADKGQRQEGLEQSCACRREELHSQALAVMGKEEFPCGPWGRKGT